ERLGPLGGSFHDVPAPAVAERIGEGLSGVVDDSVGLALVHFERTDLVDELVEDVAEVQGIEHAHAEIDGELEAGLAAGCLDPIGLLKEEDAEAIKAGVLESEAIFGFVHTEAAGAAGTSSEEDVVIDDVLLGHPLRFEPLQVTNQVPHREIGRVALAV